MIEKMFTEGKESAILLKRLQHTEKKRLFTDSFPYRVESPIVANDISGYDRSMSAFNDKVAEELFGVLLPRKWTSDLKWQGDDMIIEIQPLKGDWMPIFLYQLLYRKRLRKALDRRAFYGFVFRPKSVL